MIRPTSRVGLTARIGAQPAARSDAMTGAQSAPAAKTTKAKRCRPERFTASSTSSASRTTATAGNPHVIRAICFRRARVGSESTRMTQGHDKVPVGGSDSARCADVTAVGTDAAHIRAHRPRPPGASSLSSIAAVPPLHHSPSHPPRPPDQDRPGSSLKQFAATPAARLPPFGAHRKAFTDANPNL